MGRTSYVTVVGEETAPVAAAPLLVRGEGTGRSESWYVLALPATLGWSSRGGAPSSCSEVVGAHNSGERAQLAPGCAGASCHRRRARAATAH